MGGSVTVAGGDLYRLAAVYLGDARQWWRLAQANGLQDPFLAGVTVLAIPDPAPTLTTGLPPQ